jgi:hypothetical protein
MIKILRNHFCNASQNGLIRPLVKNKYVYEGLVIFHTFQVYLWNNSAKEGIANYRRDFSFLLKNLAWACSILEGIVKYNSFK